MNSGVLNIPNALTLARILAVPLFLSLLVEEQFSLALIVYMVAGLTDAVDGMIARMWDMRTELGAHMDPLADKLLVVSSFIALGIMGEVPRPLMIVVITRDVVILGGFLLTAAVVGKSMEMAPSIWGKMTTFFQLLCVTLVLFDVADWIDPWGWLMSFVFFATGVASVISGSDYVWRGMRWYSSIDSSAGDQA
ncbi:MAG TPA: CDP-alcohol phosphatidyltransferase family protein [Candidatus Limnocylindrales bacterium]|nr:CDP-alcohol phosphatidyltransferase family protein [Candidatus Limnocylindrales bacterium]